MKLVYLDSAAEDLMWFRHYYENIFSAGSQNARRQILSTESLTIANPEFGHLTHYKGIREFSIPNIPFSFIYRCKTSVIEIIRAWDERQNRAELEQPNS